MTGATTGGATSRRELAAAGITRPDLVTAYQECRRINGEHGRTYYLATMLLPPERRPAVHALYGFARRADDIVDDTSGRLSAAARAAALAQFCERFVRGDDDDPVLAAVHDTITRHAIAPELFVDFLAAMRSDLTVSSYPRFDDLLGYVHGSAAVIGLQLLPVLGTTPGMAEVAAPYARDLGVAFQLANFIRDVGEDLGRGRIYLPLEDLGAFDVTPELLRAGVVDGRIRRLLAFEVARTRELVRSAAAGIRLLDPASRDCVRVALTLYAGILDAVEAADYQVLDRRVSVGLRRRAAVAGRGLVRARLARRRP